MHFVADYTDKVVIFQGLFSESDKKYIRFSVCTKYDDAVVRAAEWAKDNHLTHIFDAANGKSLHVSNLNSKY